MIHGALRGEEMAGPKLTPGHWEPFSVSVSILRVKSEVRGEGERGERDREKPKGRPQRERQVNRGNYSGRESEKERSLGAELGGRRLEAEEREETIRKIQHLRRAVQTLSNFLICRNFSYVESFT